MNIKVAFKASDEWNEAVDLVRLKYRRAFGAMVTPNPDCFIVCISPGRAGGAQKVVACAGVTFGSDAGFFADQYLDEPIEQIISRLERRPASRNAIVEVGSLASSEHRAGSELVRVVAMLCWCLGKKYVLCTTTTSLRALLDTIGFDFRPLRSADAARLGAGKQEAWGHYYETNPCTGYFQLDAIAEKFAGNMGRYHFVALDLRLEDHKGEEQYGAAP